MNRRLFMQLTIGVLTAITQTRPLFGSNQLSDDINHYLLTGAIEPLDDYRYDLDGVFIENGRINVALDRAQLIVIAGRPAMGKSILIQNIAQHVSNSKDVSIGYFSENKKPHLINKMVSAQKALSESDIGYTRDEISQLNITIDDTLQLTMEEFDKSITEMVSSGHIRLLLIDSIDNIYIKKVSPDEKMEKIIQYLKKLSQKLQIPVIISVGLNHDVEHREDKRPRLTDLVNYRVVERLADSIAYLYRDEVYDEHSRLKNLIFIRSINADGRVYSYMRLKLDRKNFCLRHYEYPQYRPYL